MRQETVETGIAAALTGHLVLSTLHTNDAPGAVRDSAKWARHATSSPGALISVLAQRLARRLCPHCKVERDTDPEVARPRLPAPPSASTSPAAAALPRDRVHSRVRIFEPVVDARIREHDPRAAGADAIREAARAAGMRTLGHDAWRKLVQGLTSLDEVRPLLSLLADEAPSCPVCGHGIQTWFDHCPDCGHTLRRRCECGQALEEGWRRCPACGVEAGA